MAGSGMARHGSAKQGKVFSKRMKSDEDSDS